jgi:hypothetical protein
VASMRRGCARRPAGDRRAPLWQHPVGLHGLVDRGSSRRSPAGTNAAPTCPVAPAIRSGRPAARSGVSRHSCR